MNKLRSSLFARLLAVGFVACGATAAAQTTGTAPLPASAATPTTKLVGNFTDFAGSPENATALVTGLRTGTPITLSDPAVPTGQATTFAPGTKPMGYGNVRIALSLSRAQLASQGITNPTPEQLQGSLLGNTATGGTSQGILQMRAAGMGWGQIANSMGFKLGAVMSGKPLYPATTTVSHGRSSVVSGDTGTSGRGQGASKGVTSAAGGSASSSAAKHSGITTAAGARGGHVTSALGQGAGHANGGAVTAAGQGGGNAGNAHGGGYGKGGKP